jgi:putative SOS response-associated peptidase YedK
MLTVNADQHPVMNQYHKPGDEKRTPVILSPEQFEAWLSADAPKAASMMHWNLMPALKCQEHIIHHD